MKLQAGPAGIGQELGPPWDRPLGAVGSCSESQGTHPRLWLLLGVRGQHVMFQGQRKQEGFLEEGCGREGYTPKCTGRTEAWQDRQRVRTSKVMGAGTIP